jgi:epoxyqueuosine reductase QueG
MNRPDSDLTFIKLDYNVTTALQADGLAELGWEAQPAGFRDAPTSIFHGASSSISHTGKYMVAKDFMPSKIGWWFYLA